MTIDGAVRVTNAKNNIILALSRSGAAAALIHPHGRVYHYGSRVEIQARHQQGNNKYVFALYNVPLAYGQCLSNPNVLWVHNPLGTKICMVNVFVVES